MTDFDRWMQCQGVPKEPELPDGLWQGPGGKLLYRCRSCERSVELEVTVEEFDPEMAYCGGSPRCIP
jgi:hypothetical protein